MDILGPPKVLIGHPVQRIVQPEHQVVRGYIRSIQTQRGDGFVNQRPADPACAHGWSGGGETVIQPRQNRARIQCVENGNWQNANRPPENPNRFST